MKACKISIILLLLCATLIGQTLRVGDKAPDMSVYKWIKGNPVQEFKKGQIYLVELGATWCTPCARAIPHLTRLAKEYGDKLVIVGVFTLEPSMGKDNSYISQIEYYVKKQGNAMVYNVGADMPDSSMYNKWIQAAGQYSVPWAFLVDKNGYIAWINNPSEGIMDSSIARVESASYSLESEVARVNKEAALKKPVLNMEAPLFIDGNAGEGKLMLYRSVITQFNSEKTGAVGGLGYVCTSRQAGNRPGERPYGQMVQEVGAPLSLLYYMAYADTIFYTAPSRQLQTMEYPDTIRYPSMKSSYGKFWYKPILEMKDTSAFAYRYPLPDNRYNYSLILNDTGCSSATLQKIMQKDLDICFGYRISVETRMMPCWKLIGMHGTAQALASKMPGGTFTTDQPSDTVYHYSNAIIQDILIRMIYGFSYGYSQFGIEPLQQAPFIDATGITGGIDYSISDREFQEMRKHNWKVSLQFLHRLGLELVKSEKPTLVVVIREAGN